MGIQMRGSAGVKRLYVLCKRRWPGWVSGWRGHAMQGVGLFCHEADYEVEVVGLDYFTVTRLRVLMLVRASRTLDLAIHDL